MVWILHHLPVSTLSVTLPFATCPIIVLLMILEILALLVFVSSPLPYRGWGGRGVALQNFPLILEEIVSQALGFLLFSLCPAPVASLLFSSFNKISGLKLPKALYLPLSSITILHSGITSGLCGLHMRLSLALLYLLFHFRCLGFLVPKAPDAGGLTPALATAPLVIKLLL